MRPAELLLPGRDPQLAALGQMIALLQLLLADFARQKRMAVLVDPIGEVLTGHANHSAFPALQITLINKAPLLHQSDR